MSEFLIDPRAELTTPDADPVALPLIQSPSLSPAMALLMAIEIEPDPPVKSVASLSLKQFVPPVAAVAPAAESVDAAPPATDAVPADESACPENARSENPPSDPQRVDGAPAVAPDDVGVELAAAAPARAPEPVCEVARAEVLPSEAPPVEVVPKAESLRAESLRSEIVHPAPARNEDLSLEALLGIEVKTPTVRPVTAPSETVHSETQISAKIGPESPRAEKSGYQRLRFEILSDKPLRPEAACREAFRAEAARAQAASEERVRPARSAPVRPASARAEPARSVPPEAVRSDSVRPETLRPQAARLLATLGLKGAAPSAGVAGPARPAPRVALSSMMAMALIACLAGGFGSVVANTALGKLAVPDERLTQIAAIAETLARIDDDLAALRGKVARTAELAGDHDGRTDERIAQIEKAQAEPGAKLAKLAEAVDRLRTAQAQLMAQASSNETTGSIKAGGKKPAIVEGWTLKDVDRDTALIEGKRGLVETYVGDTIPGVGRVESFRKQDGHWVIVTAKGLIVSR